MPILKFDYKNSDEIIQFAYNKTADLFKRSVQWTQDNSLVAVRTLEMRLETGHAVAMRLAEWLRKSLDELRPEDMEAFIGFCMSKAKLKFTTIHIMLSHMNEVYKLMIHEGMCDQNLVATSQLYKKIKSKVQIQSENTPVERITTIRDFLAFRRSNGCRSIHDAMMCEVFVSSGMRISELLQLRCCDIDFNLVPMDKLEERPSIYCGGTVTISPSTSIVKMQKGRRVFVSKLAAKLMKMWMARNNMTTKSQLPFFPMPRKNASSAVCDAVKRSGIWDDRKARDRNKVVTSSGIGFLALDAQTIEEGVTPQYKKFLERTQKRKRESNADIGVTETTAQLQYNDQVVEGMSAHTLRHTAAMLHYHRNFYGGVHDLMSLKNMLGHSKLDMTDYYLKVAQDYNVSMKEWKQMMLGNGTEYRSIFIEYHSDYLKSLQLFK